MNNEILIEIRFPYGKETIYPICNRGRLLADYKNQKTLTRRDIQLLKELGFTFTVKQQTL